MEKYYRLVDPNFEIPNRVIDTELSEVSPRMIRSLELAPLFKILINFWRKSGVQLTTAFNSMFLFADYIKEVQYIESQGEYMIPTCLFSTKEPLKEVPLGVLKEMMFPYYDLFNKDGSIIGPDDATFIWEYLWEIIRINYYPERLSRYNSVFLFGSYVQAESFKDMVYPYSDKVICSVDLLEFKRMEKYDANWLDTVPTDCTYDIFLDSSRKYWAQELTEYPNIEYLFSGKYVLNL